MQTIAAARQHSGSPTNLMVMVLVLVVGMVMMSCPCLHDGMHMHVLVLVRSPGLLVLACNGCTCVRASGPGACTTCKVVFCDGVSSGGDLGEPAHITVRTL